MDKEAMEREAMEKDFKEMMFKVFSEKIPGTTYDEETGFITIPVRRPRRPKKED